MNKTEYSHNNNSKSNENGKVNREGMKMKKKKIVVKATHIRVHT